LSKAFDKVPHVRICHKLSSYAFRGSGYKVSCQEDLNKLYLANGKDSNPCSVLTGALQGSVLGLLLFLCYINDMPKCVKSSTRLYGDDVFILQQIGRFILQQIRIFSRFVYANPMGIYLANDI